MLMLLQVEKWRSKQIWIGTIKRRRKLRFNGPAEPKAAGAQLRLLKVKFFSSLSDSKWQMEERNEKKKRIMAQTREKRMWNNQRREKTRGKQRKEWKHHTSKVPPSSLGALKSNKTTKFLLFSPQFTCSFFISPSEPDGGSRCLQTFATESLQEICRPSRPCSFKREMEQQMAEEKGCGDAIWDQRGDGDERREEQKWINKVWGKTDSDSFNKRKPTARALLAAGGDRISIGSEDVFTPFLSCTITEKVKVYKQFKSYF